MALGLLHMSVFISFLASVSPRALLQCLALSDHFFFFLHGWSGSLMAIKCGQWSAKGTGLKA